MSWGRNRKPLARLAAALVLSTVATAAVANVVVRATGPSAKSYRAGMKLPDNAKINLKANDTLVLLRNGGGTRILRGPGNFTPSSPSQASSGSVALASAGARRARIGAVRTLIGASDLSVWLVDIEKSSNVCVVDPKEVTLWRANVSQAVTMTISGQGGSTQELEWARGQAQLKWPPEMAISEGTEYKISWKGLQKPTHIKFKRLSADPTNDEDVAAALIENGCQAQLDALIAAKTDPEAQTASTS